MSHVRGDRPCSPPLIRQQLCLSGMKRNGARKAGRPRSWRQTGLLGLVSPKGRGSGCEGAASTGGSGWHSSQGLFLLSLLRVWLPRTTRNAVIYPVQKQLVAKFDFFHLEQVTDSFAPNANSPWSKEKVRDSWNRE